MMNGHELSTFQAVKVSFRGPATGNARCGAPTRAKGGPPPRILDQPISLFRPAKTTRDARIGAPTGELSYDWGRSNTLGLCLL